jgi:hypothetical protein
MSGLDVDPVLRRIERLAIGLCLGMAAVALGAERGEPAVAIGVLGGGFIVGVSYWAIRTSISGLIDRMNPTPRTRPAGEVEGRPAGPGPLALVGRLAGRYALLALLAYVMIARLRLHPIGMVIGASSVVVATTCEAVRMLAAPRDARRR